MWFDFDSKRTIVLVQVSTFDSFNGNMCIVFTRKFVSIALRALSNGNVELSQSQTCFKPLWLMTNWITCGEQSLNKSIQLITEFIYIITASPFV